MNDRKTNQPAIDTTIADDQSAMTLAFSNGQTLTLRAADLSQDIIARAVMHGLKQKLVDAAAISRDPETGRAATIETKFAAVKEVYDRLLSGDWNKRREGGAGASGGLLFRALCRMYEGKKSADDIKAFLEAKTDAEKAALRKNAKVAAIIEEIRAESTKPGDANADDLLADLEG